MNSMWNRSDESVAGGITCMVTISHATLQIRNKNNHYKVFSKLFLRTHSFTFCTHFVINVLLKDRTEWKANVLRGGFVPIYCLAAYRGGPHCPISYSAFNLTSAVFGLI